jgi:hypothetical protein
MFIETGRTPLFRVTGGDGLVRAERAGMHPMDPIDRMQRAPQFDRHRIRATALLLAVVFGAFWLNTRRPATADRNRPRSNAASSAPASVVLPAVCAICAICGKPIIGPVMVRRYDDGATDRIHPACYRPANSDPPVKAAR